MIKYAFYLPQFHEIPENNMWWGQGFTEWTNVKKAVPLFKYHKQPKVPLNNNYYNLLDKSTVAWQTNLMQKYKVDGFIYYHYYFCGRKVLEKPAENLLIWKDIEQPFFFCWANHSWNRSWNGSKELLIEQKYGGITEWEEHFQYLRQFFLDDRYIKIDNMPAFMIFNSDFPEKNDLFSYFDKRCRDEGFAGIYLIETFKGTGDWPNDYISFKNDLSSVTKKIFLREYLVAGNIFVKYKRYYYYRTIRKIVKVYHRLIHREHVECYSGNVFYNIMIDHEPYDNSVIHGAFFEWDNTPRHGNRGSIISPPTKKLFMKFMNKCKNDTIIFNAWNEWAEGMVLEPTEENGYKYLEWIREWTEKNE